jgi:hypothetical protein
VVASSIPLKRTITSTVFIGLASSFARIIPHFSCGRPAYGHGHLLIQ